MIKVKHSKWLWAGFLLFILLAFLWFGLMPDISRLKKENPTKKFIPVSEQAVCPNMKLITLEKVLWSLEEMSPEVKVAEDIRLRARSAVDRMLNAG